MKIFRLLGFFTFFVISLSASVARADIAEPWQLGFQEPATEIMEKMVDFHDLLMVVITVITLFVTALLGYACWRFSAKRNPTPSKTSHNTILEIAWTTIPVLILVLIAIPSFRLLYFQLQIPQTEMTLKVIGYQWYWGYEYPDNGDIAFDSYMKKEEDLKAGEPRLLAVDNEVVLPVDTNIRIQITAADVLHAWAVPALGLKSDAVPGRLNELWVNIKKPGKYYGQCSELCGVYHGFMPVVVRAVSKEEFKRWVKTKTASLNKNTDANIAAVNIQHAPNS